MRGAEIGNAPLRVDVGSARAQALDQVVRPFERLRQSGDRTAVAGRRGGADRRK
jgi:hypothetical protein